MCGRYEEAQVQGVSSPRSSRGKLGVLSLLLMPSILPGFSSSDSALYPAKNTTLSQDESQLLFGIYGYVLAIFEKERKGEVRRRHILVTVLS